MSPAIEKPAARPLCLRLDLNLVDEGSDLATVLKLALSNLPVAASVVYRFDAKLRAFGAVAWKSTVLMPSRAIDSELDSSVARFLRRLDLPFQCRSGGQFFDSFPETLHCGLERILIVPLILRESVKGFLTLGRTEDRIFTGSEIDGALIGARLLRVVLERDELEHNLASRKILERAKGILRRTRRLTEEEAYLTLRDLSRCRQCAMVDVARDLIDADLCRSYGAQRGARKTS